MATPNILHKKNGQYLWFALLGLGFEQDTAASSLTSKAGIAKKRVNLGVSMFDLPNKDAFYSVSHFLLKKLNPTRFQEAYRHCWPVLDHKADVEFRKVTCSWLKEIMTETANAGSKVSPSLFISPGGPKFTTLMLDLAKHVMLQEMKTFHTDDSWVPEAAAKPASTVDMAVKRLILVRSRFLKGVEDQDHFLQEYQRRAKLLVKTRKELKAEEAKYDALLKQHSRHSTEGEEETAEKIQKVRSLWSAINGMLSTIKASRGAVDCVLKGEVDQYVLDGTDQVLKIPQCLLERIEQLPHQLRSGNVYEADQVNLLSVMELTNHALQMLKESRHRQASDASLSAPLLQDKRQLMGRMLQDLHLIRQRISKEEIPQRKSSIKQLKADWDRKWQDALKDTALISFLNEDPALGFLSPMAPLSFDPAGEVCYGNSVFSQYPAKLLEVKLPEEPTREDAAAADDDYSNLRSSNLAESPSVATETPRLNTSLDWLLNTPPSPPLKTPSVTSAPQASSKKTGHSAQNQLSTTSQSGILDREYDNLADQFADAVVTTSPSESQEKGSDLEDLLSLLQKDPFSTRKQLPRTPESLILDVKTSWRKAIQEDGVKKNLSSVYSDGITGRPSPPGPLQGVLQKTMVSWDTFNTEHSLSGAAQFSLEYETLPETSSCDSLLSLNDDELLIPRLLTETEQSPSPSFKTRQAYGSSQLLENIRTPECVQINSDWLAKLETTDGMFSLDLDQLEKTSPAKKQDYTLPTLITFSPIDDMK